MSGRRFGERHFQVKTRLTPLKIALIYAVIGGLWIFFSDTALMSIAKNPQAMTRIAIIKGWVYVIVTGCLLFWLIRRFDYDRKKKEESLRISETFLNSIFDQSPYATWISDEKGTLIRLNQACRDLLQISDEDVVGKYDVLKDNVVEEQGRMPLVRRVFEAGETVRFELKYDSSQLKHLQMSNFASVFLDVTIFPIKDGQGRITNAVIQHKDITDRKRAEELLRRSEASLEAAQKRAHLGSWELDPVTQTGSWSKEMFRLLGRDLSQGVPPIPEFMDLVHPEDREKIMEAHTRTLGTGETSTIDYRTNPERGPLRVINTSIHCVKNAEGKIVRLAGTALDITERKQAEESLRTSEKKYRNLVATMNEGLGVLDRNGLVVFMNQRACEMLGYELEELIGKSPAFLFDEENQKILREQMAQRREGNRQRYELAWTRKDGGTIITIVVPSPVFDEKGAYDGSVAVFTDITDRKKLEEQLLQAHKMEAIGTLTGGIAHDFNNILSAIVGYGAMLKMKMADDDPLRSYVDQILIASERAASLIRSLLVFSGKQLMKVSPVDINELIIKVEKLLRRIIGEDIDITTSLTSQNLRVEADAGQIEQVLLNLATNARDAMPNGGMLSIATGIAEADDAVVKEMRGGTYAFFLVTDTGGGMDEKTRRKIFDPFFTTKDTGKGTGLGLFMVYGIVRRHGGSIHCYSEPGKGTTFKVCLPLRGPLEKKSALKAGMSVPEKMKRGSETVLVAEDDGVLRKLIRTTLEYSGYAVIEAVDGDDAVRKFQENKEKISLFLCDVIMPKKSGAEAGEAIKKISPELKIVFMSGYPADIIRQKGLLDEKAEIILKPVSPIALLSKIREVLDR